jgi:MinD-like ATPase involved in chromosome partitioning or flagellar assembly/tetratricopeptide (TPR) repeat protein
MNQGPRIITFYSYKGGVGRSMALLNVAYTLQSLGRHVLVIDLDLEAPGVSGFLTRNKELEPHPADQPDVVDFLKAALPIARWQPGSTDRPIIPKLSEYLRSVRPDCFASAVNPRFAHARIDVLAANDANDYANRLAELNVAGFSAEDLEELGNVVRDLIARHQFPYARLKDEPTVPTKYDYVLVDSRTGFTETSGLCIGPLSDRLVVFTGLNDQNINGTAEFLSVVGLSAGARSEPWDDQDDIKDTTKYAARIGRKPTLLVASPVPRDETDLKKDRFEAIERIIGAPPNFFITYHPRLALFETIFLRDFPSEGISKEYRELTDAILHVVQDDARHLRLIVSPKQILGQQTTDPDKWAVLRLAAMLDEEKATETSDRCNLDGITLSQRALSADPHEASELYAKSFRAFANALELNPKNHEALTNWGVALYQRANLAGCEEPEQCLKAALEKFQAAHTVNTQSHAVFYNQGIALTKLAKLKDGAEAYSLLSEAERCFSRAINLNLMFPEAFTNLGGSFLEQSKFVADSEAEGLILRAGSAFETALSIRPDSPVALNNWGTALAAQAKRKSGPEADALLAAAVEKFESALSIQPDNHSTLNNLGVALSRQARSKKGSEADALFAEAEEKYLTALAIKPGRHDVLYNLACLQGLRGSAGGAVDWLRKAVAAGHEVTREKLAGDGDFERVRDAAAFREFVAGLSQ